MPIIVPKLKSPTCSSMPIRDLDNFAKPCTDVSQAGKDTLTVDWHIQNKCISGSPFCCLLFYLLHFCVDCLIFFIYRGCHVCQDPGTRNCSKLGVHPETAVLSRITQHIWYTRLYTEIHSNKQVQKVNSEVHAILVPTAQVVLHFWTIYCILQSRRHYIHQCPIAVLQAVELLEKSMLQSVTFRYPFLFSVLLLVPWSCWFKIACISVWVSSESWWDCCPVEVLVERATLKFCCLGCRHRWGDQHGCWSLPGQRGPSRFESQVWKNLDRLSPIIRSRSNLLRIYFPGNSPTSWQSNLNPSANLRISRCSTFTEGWEPVDEAERPTSHPPVVQVPCTLPIGDVAWPGLIRERRRKTERPVRLCLEAAHGTGISMYQGSQCPFFLRSAQDCLHNHACPLSSIVLALRCPLFKTFKPSNYWARRCDWVLSLFGLNHMV